ncbi:MAG: peptide chain release factor N(5)-glutamine methyltransferase [Alphaproteobacteria bacterium]|nr:peptide chain release factor N(5)-glutamine methyltransferase [Alphaproteobacteria bacterium]
MNENQAFQILRKYGSANDARIIARHIFKSRFAVLVAAWRLRRGVPVAKIIGKKWFYGMEFITGRHTLDPRPDSETLVDAVLKNIGAQTRAPAILDLGTGTGCLICAIVKNTPGATGIGIDKSGAACRVARHNVKKHGLENRIQILKKDFKSQISNFKSQFDIIISNPPYIAVGDSRVDTGASHDPKMALYSGADGLDSYRAISASARHLLKPKGRAFFEIGAGQGDAVRELFAASGWTFVASQNDLSGTERVLVFGG